MLDTKQQNKKEKALQKEMKAMKQKLENKQVKIEIQKKMPAEAVVVREKIKKKVIQKELVKVKKTVNLQAKFFQCKIIVLQVNKPQIKIGMH